MVQFGGETVLTLQVLGQIVQVFVAKELNAPAVAANQVVMRLLRRDFVQRHTVDFGCYDETQVLEKPDGAVDRRAVYCGCLLMDACVDFADGGVSAYRTQRVDDHLALWRHAVASLANALCVAELVVRHGQESTYCENLQ